MTVSLWGYTRIMVTQDGERLLSLRLRSLNIGAFIIRIGFLLKGSFKDPIRDLYSGLTNYNRVLVPIIL